jgi:hypothetical protein
MGDHVVIRGPPGGQASHAIRPGMYHPPRMVLCFAVPWAFAMAGPLMSAPALAEPPGEPALTVTTDTAEYCEALNQRIAGIISGAPEPPSEEVSHLSAEGQRLCDDGRPRAGIARLRRVLLMLRPPGE